MNPTYEHLFFQTCRRKIKMGLTHFSGTSVGKRDLPCYSKIYRKSIQDPVSFWAQNADRLYWHERWKDTLDSSNSPFNKWFVGGKFNMCYNALDIHVVAGYGQQKAIIYDSPLAGKRSSLTFDQLLDQVSRLGHLLIRYGVRPGDRVLIYMPMIPQAMVAMLACARIGAIHSLVFGGFGAKELSVRIKHAEPKVILTASHGLEPNRVVPYKPIMDQAIQMSNFKPSKCIIYQREGMDPQPHTKANDVDWVSELAASSYQDCIPIPGESPLYILYTSGTTGLPKGIVRPSAGYAVALLWSMSHIYDINPGEVFWSASDLGWVVGHSYACYGPLLNRNTTVMYEGKPIGTPDTGAYFRIASEYNVAGMFTAPTALRAIRRDDPNADQARKYPIKNLRSIFLAGEHCDHETLEWAKEKFGVPVIDHWWQTETGWPMTSSCLGMRDATAKNIKNPPRGTTGKPVPGWDIELREKTGPDVSEMADEVGLRPLGRILAKLPLPPGFMSTLWRADDRFRELYFKNYPGYYDSYDAGIMDADGYVSVMSRIDDVLNVAGHRLSASAIEEAIMENQDLAECAVIGVPDPLKGQVPLALCVPKYGVRKPESDIKSETIKLVRDVIGPVASLKLVAMVTRLPKTRSGKISRVTMVALATDSPFDVPVTIEDPTVYNDIRKSLQQLGYALKCTRTF